MENTFICKICKKEQDNSQIKLNWYSENYRQSPIPYSSHNKLTCKTCSSINKRKRNDIYQNGNKESYREYQRQYHAKRRSTPTAIYDRMILLFNQFRDKLNIPELIWSDKHNDFIPSVIFAEDKKDFYKFLEKNNIENFAQLKVHFKGDVVQMYKQFKKSCKIQILTQDEMLAKRNRKTSDELNLEKNNRLLYKDENNPKFIEHLDKDGENVRRVITTYLFYLKGRRIRLDKLQVGIEKALLDIEFMKLSKMFYIRINKKEERIITSAYARNFLLKKFGIKDNDFNIGKEKLMLDYVVKHLNSVYNDKKVVDKYKVHFRALIKELTITFMLTNMQNNFFNHDEKENPE